ncbi:hypothetical protein Tco_0650742, partial [Tanacetum coccineum]
MDLFNLISASNTAKVKTGTRPRAAHEVPLLTATATRVIDMEEGAGTRGQARDEEPHEIPSAGNLPTTEVAPDLEPEAASMGSLVRKRRRERGSSIFVTPTDAKSVRDPDSLSYAEPRPFPEQEIAQYLSTGMGHNQQLSPGHSRCMPRRGRPYSVAGWVSYDPSYVTGGEPKYPQELFSAVDLLSLQFLVLVFYFAGDVVFVMIIGIVVVVSGVPSIIKLSFVIIGFLRPLVCELCWWLLPESEVLKQ